MYALNSLNLTASKCVCQSNAAKWNSFRIHEENNRVLDDGGIRIELISLTNFIRTNFSIVMFNK